MWNTTGVRSSVISVGFLHALLMAMFLALPSLWVNSGLPADEHAQRYLIMMLAGAVPAFLMVGFVESASPVDLGPALGRGVFDLGLCLDGWSDEPAVDVGGRRQFVFLCLQFIRGHAT